MDAPETSSDSTTSQPNVNNPDLHVIQQTLSSLNTGAPRSSSPPFPSFDPIKIVQLLDNAGENGSTDFKIYSVQGNIPVSLIVDSGSSVNLINSDTLERLQSINQSKTKVPSKTKILPYGTTTPIETKGQFDITICYKQRQTPATFHVTKSSPQGLLSYKTSSELGILAVEINNIASTNHVQPEIKSTSRQPPTIKFTLKLMKQLHQILTVNESLQKMQGTTVFTELDLSQGYLQLSLAPETRFITAFPTPDHGPHHFTRLVMGAFHPVNI